MAPITLALALFSSNARGQALHDLPKQDSDGPRVPPVPVLVDPTNAAAKPIAGLTNLSIPNPSTPASAALAADKALDPPENKLGNFLTKVKEFAYFIAGQQTVDLVVVSITTASVTIGSLLLGLAAKRKLFPDALSSYVLEPVPRDNGLDEEYLSTRTVTGHETSLKSIYGCSPHLRRAIKKAEKYAKKHPELPILFFSSEQGPEIFTLLRTATSSDLANSVHVQAAVRNASVRYKQLVTALTGAPPRTTSSEITPMEKVFLTFTYERYDAISARLVLLPAKDVISLLVQPERWFDAAHQIPVMQDRDAALRRLVRQLEIATTLVIDRPKMFMQYLSNQPEVLRELENSSLALRKMLLLRPKESLAHVEQWMSDRAEARKAGKPMPRSSASPLSESEEETLKRLLCNTTAHDPKPEEILPHSNRDSANGAKPPYTYDRRSNWHAVIDIPVGR